MVYINILNLYVAYCCVFLFILWCIFLCVYYAAYKLPGILMKLNMNWRVVILFFGQKKATCKTLRENIA